MGLEWEHNFFAFYAIEAMALEKRYAEEKAWEVLERLKRAFIWSYFPPAHPVVS